MRKIYVYVIFLFIGLFVNAQSQNEEFRFKAHQIDKLIKEVYQDKAETMIFSDKIRYNSFKDLLLNRIFVKKVRFKKGEKLIDLTKAPLLIIYNKNLVRNYSFTQNTFNPLKYDIALFSNDLKLYRIDKNHVLYVLGQKN
ncbi:MAG: hypothetical protein AAF617_01345 [Bacteroidota bacterium]